MKVSKELKNLIFFKGSLNSKYSSKDFNNIPHPELVLDIKDLSMEVINEIEKWLVFMLGERGSCRSINNYSINIKTKFGKISEVYPIGGNTENFHSYLFNFKDWFIYNPAHPDILGKSYSDECGDIESCNDMCNSQCNENCLGPFPTGRDFILDNKNKEVF